MAMRDNLSVRAIIAEDSYKDFAQARANALFGFKDPKVQEFLRQDNAQQQQATTTQVDNLRKE